MMLILNIIPALTHNADIMTYLRLAQLFLIIIFCQLLIRINIVNYTAYIYVIAWGSLILLIVEILFVGDSGFRDYFGLWVARYRGVIGDFNFSAFLLCGIAIISLIKAKPLLATICLLVSLFTFSRGATLAVLVAFMFWLLHKEFNKVCKLATIIALLGVLCYPFVIYLSYKLLNEEQLLLLNSFSSSRLMYHIGYTQLGLDNLVFGTGYFNSNEEFERYAPAIYSYDVILEQHNIFIQVFSEFGLVGLVLFGIFLNQIRKKSFKCGPGCTALFIFVITCLMFLNGLNEFAFWLSVAFIISYERSLSYYRKK